MQGIEDLPFTIAELHRAYRAGLRPAAVVREVLRRLEQAADPGIFIAIASEADLLHEAEVLGAFDEALPLWGIPAAVKDNIDVTGFPTTAACPDYAYEPTADATAVAKLREAGALIVGKTNLDQFATGLIGVRTPYPVPRNAIDPAIVPGGSSSGSAIAVARGIVAIALGTDTAGSGRVPAALNNIVGLKPSLGIVSTSGVVPACRSLDCVSLFALTVADASVAFAAIRGFDSADPFSVRTATSAVKGDVRVGIPRAQDLFFTSELHRAAFDTAVEAIRDNDLATSEVDISACFEVAALLYDGPWIAERFAAIGDFLSAKPDAVLDVTRTIIERGKQPSAADAFRGVYRLRDLQRRVERIWSEVDVLCLPSIPGRVSLSEIERDPTGPNMMLGTYTNFVNLLGLCALAVPAGECRDGFPAGVTLIAPAGADATLACLGRRLHSVTTGRLGATDWPVPLQPLPTDEEMAPGGIDLIVLGAHLRGLPLNGDLLACGGRFVEEVRTAPDYRLHALEGRVARPGLVRCQAGAGAEITGEMWRLPPAGFGRFVSGIAVPLSIGHVRLDDGRLVLGFLAEAEGVRGAPDITKHGSWRNYLAADADMEDLTG